MKVRVHARLSPETGARLREHCLRRRKSYASVVETAVRDHLNGSAEPALLLQRLDRVDGRIDRLEDKLDLLTETVAAFMKIWYAHHPPLAEEAEKAARELAGKRYDKFTKFVAEQLAKRARGNPSQEGVATPSTTATVTSDTPLVPRSKDSPR